MKKLLYILTILLLGCNSYNEKNKSDSDNTGSTVQQDTTTQVVASIAENVVFVAKKFEFKNPNKPVEDTLILNTDNKDFLITPLGLFKTYNKDSIRLETELIVERAYLYETDEYFYIFFTDTDNDGATSWIQKLSKSPLKSEYVEQIQGFNLGQPIIDGKSAYVSAIGFIGKIDLNTGSYIWKHHNLYDKEKYSFNSFDTVIIENNQIEFVSENYRSKKVDKVIVNNQTGELKDIIK
jgi:hypothetical protein